MRTLMLRRGGFGAGLWVVGLLATAAGAQNLGDLPLTKTTELTTKDNETINRYLDPMATTLVTSEDDVEVQQARKALIEPFRVGASSVFQIAYSTRLSAKLTALRAVASNRRPFNRLNAMIVVGALIDRGAVALVEDGLKDESSATRYLGAQAVSQLGSQELITNTERLGLLKAVAAALQGESEAAVANKLLDALVALNISEAADQLLTALDARLTMHASNPPTSLAAEEQALRNLFQQFIQKRLNEEAIAPELQRKLVRVVIRYMELGAKMARQAEGRRGDAVSFKSMVGLCEKVLTWAQPKPEEGALPDVNQPLRLQQWDVVLLRVEDWKAVLKGPPFNLTHEELRPAAPAQPG